MRKTQRTHARTCRVVSSSLFSSCLVPRCARREFRCSSSIPISACRAHKSPQNPPQPSTLQPHQRQAAARSYKPTTCVCATTTTTTPRTVFWRVRVRSRMMCAPYGIVLANTYTCTYVYSLVNADNRKEFRRKLSRAQM